METKRVPTKAILARCWMKMDCRSRRYLPSVAASRANKCFTHPIMNELKIPAKLVKNDENARAWTVCRQLLSV